ncbi:MAG: zinc ribbon domain-containing protein [Nitrospirae bacterium]|nr:zinc ribbon domain-containing protein [Nitrospirota bacterium]
MPIYEYICNKCNKNFTLFHWISSTEDEILCPGCGSRDISKKISKFSCSISATSSSGNISGFSGGG